MSETFYGGIPGISFVIVKYYDTIEALVKDFNSQSCTVNFGEYVLISNENLLYEHNGRLYRRGYQKDATSNIEDYTNPGGGAIYCGCTVGPKGEAPNLKLETYEDVNNTILKYSGDTDWIAKHAPDTKDYDIDLVFKTNDGDQTDQVRIAQYIDQSENSNESSVIHYGIQLPELNPNITLEEINPYTEQPSIKYTTTPGHMLTGDLNFKLPKPKKPASIQIESAVSDENGLENKYTITDFSGTEEEGTKIELTEYVKANAASTNSAPSITYGVKDGESATVPIGGVNSINMEADGTLSFYSGTTSDSPLIYSNTDNKIKWIESASQNNDGTITFNYNTGENDTTTIPGITHLSIIQTIPAEVTNSLIKNWDNISFNAAGLRILEEWVEPNLFDENGLLVKELVVDINDIVSMNNITPVNAQGGIFAICFGQEESIQTLFFVPKTISVTEDGVAIDWIALGGINGSGKSVASEAIIFGDYEPTNNTQWPLNAEIDSIFYRIEEDGSSYGAISSSIEGRGLNV